MPIIERSRFGNHIHALIGQKGIRSRAELARLLRENGYEIDDNTLYNYVHGRTTAPPRFARKLIEVLHLSDEEQRELERAFVRGQG